MFLDFVCELLRFDSRRAENNAII